MGPAFWQVDLAISKVVPVGTQRVELRLETFNLFDTFNPGDPVTNFNSGNFGRITTYAGDPLRGDPVSRVLQFGVKYDF